MLMMVLEGLGFENVLDSVISTKIRMYSQTPRQTQQSRQRLQHFKWYSNGLMECRRRKHAFTKSKRNLARIVILKLCCWAIYIHHRINSNSKKNA